MTDAVVDNVFGSAGYMARVKPMSRQQAVSTYTATNISTVVTTAIENYLRSFFDSTGKHNGLLAQFAPGLEKYVSDNDFDASLDPTKTALKIERYSERIAAAPPCVVINDTGSNPRSPGFGRSAWQSRPQKQTIAHCIPVMREVNVTLLAVASSKSSLTSLVQALHVIFFDLAVFTCGRYLVPDNSSDTWVVRLPATIDPGTYDKANQNEDPQMQLWSTTVGLTLVFEDAFQLADSDIHYDTNSVFDTTLSLDFPANIRVGQRVSGTVRNLQFGMVVASSNHNIATLTQGNMPSEYLVLAKKPGIVSIVVIDSTQTPNRDGQGSSAQPVIHASIDITISF